MHQRSCVFGACPQCATLASTRAPATPSTSPPPAATSWNMEQIWHVTAAMPAPPQPPGRPWGTTPLQHAPFALSASTAALAGLLTALAAPAMWKAASPPPPQALLEQTNQRHAQVRWSFKPGLVSLTNNITNLYDSMPGAADCLYCFVLFWAGLGLQSAPAGLNKVTLLGPVCLVHKAPTPRRGVHALPALRASPHLL